MCPLYDVVSSVSHHHHPCGMWWAMGLLACVFLVLHTCIQKLPVALLYLKCLRCLYISEWWERVWVGVGLGVVSVSASLFYAVSTDLGYKVVSALSRPAEEDFTMKWAGFYVCRSLFCWWVACGMLTPLAQLSCYWPWAQCVMTTQAQLSPVPLLSAQCGLQLDPILLSCPLGLW